MDPVNCILDFNQLPADFLPVWQELHLDIATADIATALLEIPSGLETGGAEVVSGDDEILVTPLDGCKDVDKDEGDSVDIEAGVGKELDSPCWPCLLTRDVGPAFLLTPIRM